MTAVHFLGVGAALPGPGATNSSFLVRTPEATLLIDCGPAVLGQLAAAGLSPGDVSHVFISHRHGDHALGYPMFLLWWALEGLQRGRTPPTVVASAVTWESLRALCEHSYRDLPRVPVRAVALPADAPAVHALAPGVTLRTWPMVHSTFAPVLGVRVEVEGTVLAFTADTAPCPAVGELARAADLLVHDAFHSATAAPAAPAGSPYHCTARQAGEHAAAAGARELALVHIAAEYDGQHDALVAEARAVFGGRVFAPTAGMVWTL
jgi:ribonuclease BN (tRNA processing enzyme)